MSLKLARWAFLLLAASLPLVRVVEVGIAGYPLPITDFIFVACGLFFVFAVLRGETALKWEKFFLLVAAYAAVLALSAAFSVDPSKSVVKLAGELYLFGLAFIAYQLLSDRDFQGPFIKAWLVGTGISAAGAIYGAVLFYIGYKTQAENSFLSHFGSLPAGNYPRLRSTFANANMAANYLNISVMLLLFAGASGYFKRSWQRTMQILVWLTALATLSPGLGGMMLSAGLWYRRRFARTGRALLATVALCVAIATSAAFFMSTLISPDTPNTDSQITLLGRTFEPSVRVLVWQSALQTVSQNPLLGRGVGIDPAAVRYETLSGDRQFLRDAHNIPLNVAGQSGLLGLAVFTLMIVYLLKTMRKGADDLRFALSLAFIATFLYQGLTGSFEDARHVWLLIGFILAANRD